MQFTSRYAGYNMPVIEEERQFYPDGRSRMVKPLVVADFQEQALALETYSGVDSEDSPTFAGPRGGGFYDTVQAQKEHQWTDEVRETVEQRLLEIASNGPRADEYRMLPPHQRPSGFGDIRVYSEPAPVAPFQNYDKLNADKIVRIASELSLEEAALAYEQRTKQRQNVMGPLAELIDMKDAEKDLTAA